MGTVSDYIFNLIAKQVDNYGLVVWYDPDGVHAEAANALDLSVGRGTSNNSVSYGSIHMVF